jgi:hypothetical protein
VTEQMNVETTIEVESSALIPEHRPAISKKLRFEVFKRDSFTCQYCGKRAPDVVLHCDHVKPVAEGGPTDMLNLVTACIDCNLGKGARELSDDAALTRQLNQLASLQERREQIEMMLAWQSELEELDELPVRHLEQRWSEVTNYSWTDNGKSSIRKLIKRYRVDTVARSMKTAMDQYLDKDKSGYSAESVAKTFDYIGRIANVDFREQRQPGTRQMLYIRGILRNRLSGRYCNEYKALALIKEAAQIGIPLDTVEDWARESISWSQWRNQIEASIADAREQNRWNNEWRASIYKRLTATYGDIPEGAAVDLIQRAMCAGMSQEYVMGVASGSTWEDCRALMERAIAWRNRLLAPLREVLDYLPEDDEELAVIHEALDAGIHEHAILAEASQVRHWPALKTSLEQATDEVFQQQLRSMGEERPGLVAPD